MIDLEKPDYNTDAYDEIMARRDARMALSQQDELVEELTGVIVPGHDEIGMNMRGFLWLVAGTFILMSLFGLIANPIGGFALAGILSLLWCWMVSAAKEVAASADGAGNMYRTQRVGPEPGWAEQREAREEIVKAVAEHESASDLLTNLDNPDYVRTLKEALHRDEHGWTMSD
jgi:hypothetical protein